MALVITPIVPTVNAEMTTSFQQTGNLGLEVVGAAGGNTLITGGTLTLVQLPVSANVVRATLYASQVANPDGQDARFAGTNLSTASPFASDVGPLELYAYRWDVTSLITPGTNAYSFRVGGYVDGSPIAGVALLVVWQDWTEPTRIITVNDGILQVGAEGGPARTTDFTGIGDGETDLWLFTVLDDVVSTGETVEYNGVNIGGPLDQNLGPLASLLQLSSNSVAGTNTLRVATGFDSLGWMIAATAVQVPSVSVAPTTWHHVKELYR